MPVPLSLQEDEEDEEDEVDPAKEHADVIKALSAIYKRMSVKKRS